MSNLPIKPPYNLLKPAPAFLVGLFVLLIGTALLEILPLLGINLSSLLWQIWLPILVVGIFISLFDIIALWRLASPTLQRTLPNHLALNRWQEVTLLISNTQPTFCSLSIFDHPPTCLAFQQLPQAISLLPEGQYLLKYQIKPLERGNCQWSICELTLNSPWRLWQQRRHIQLESNSKIYPDFTKLYGSKITTIEQWIYYLGIKSQAKRGLGQDFHQLREFREGDTLRQIDWNATAKQKMPITKEYQEERDQHIIFLIDCGQRMRIKENQLTHFDHALNACLLLSYVAIRQGDAVGLTTFASDKSLFIKPAKGQQQLNTLLNNVYNLQCTQQPADYSHAIQTLLAKTKRRALVIVVTNLRYSEDAETIKAFKYLSKYHRVLITSLKEESRDEIAHQPVTNFNEALTYCGDIHQLVTRAQLHDQLATLQLPLLDVYPKQLGPQLISRYLSLKKSGML